MQHIDPPWRLRCRLDGAATTDFQALTAGRPLRGMTLWVLPLANFFWGPKPELWVPPRLLSLWVNEPVIKKRSPSLQIVTDPRQDYLEVRVRVTIHVGLDNSNQVTLLATTLLFSPPNANDWPPLWLELGIDRRKVDHVLSLNEVHDGIWRGHGAVGYGGKEE